MALAIVSLLAAIFLIVLPRYIIEERVRAENQKELEKNIKNWDNKNGTKQKK